MDINVNELSISRPALMRDVRSKPEQPQQTSMVDKSQVDPDPSSVDPQEKRTSPEELHKAVSSAEAYAQSIRRDLKFSLDEDSGQVIVKVTDSATGEVIRQMPSEEAVKLAQRLEEARSLLFKTKA